MSTRIDEKVVVITGASSGIGKATALAFAAKGARLALGARREKELEDTAAACRKAGSGAVSLVIDVADEDQVQSLADRAVQEFGRFDVWFNNAGMDVFGAFGDIPTAAFERVIRINLMGTVHGCRAALRHFRERGSGIVINNASMVGSCPTPFHSAYVASKFAIRGLSHSLCQELLDQPGIHVCTVSPASIDTPLWQRAGNYSRRRIKALDPVYPAEQVADVVVELARFPQREVFPGGAGWMLAEQYAAAPQTTETMMAAFVRRSLFQDEPAEPSDGALFTPGSGNGDISGGWLAPGSPSIPGSELMTLAAAPGFLATAPALYAWQLSCNFVLQAGMQFNTEMADRWLSAVGYQSVGHTPMRRLAL
jgi:NAD(P)-dependent dehydrogenase (short-subunit alcohol dehydrogenase family)